MNNPFETLDARLTTIESLLRNLCKDPVPHNPDSDANELLTVQGAAEYLRLSVATIYTLTSRGELPVMKRSKRCYYSRTELYNYLKKGRKKTLDELESNGGLYLKQKKGNNA